jgi:asparagine synthase (glutamine-hydrolysing)
VTAEQTGVIDAIRVGVTGVNSVPFRARSLEERLVGKALSGPALRDYAVRRTQELFKAAVEKRLMSDVPFGVLLSGGIDSSANVAVMSQLMDRPVRTFTVGFSDHEHLNELEWARKVAKRFSTEHHEVMVDEKAMRDYLPSLVFSQDEPIADWVCIPLYFVSKLVRDSGTVVVQVGEGSDEQFCRLPSYMMYLDMYRRFWRPFSRLPGRRAGPPRAGARLHGITDTRTYSTRRPRRRGREPFWSGADGLPGVAQGAARGPPPRAARVPGGDGGIGLLPEAFGRADSYEIVRSFFDRIDRAAPGTDVLNRMIYSEFKLRLPELLLMRVDKIGMSVSIEPRVPFLDHLLVELTMKLPVELKVSSRFFERFPASRMVVVDMLDRHREGRAEFALYVWTIYNAVAWFDYWVDKSREVRVA